jgi:16S rRNA processing protein RimM
MPESRILLGVIGRPHGVRGLVHVTSHTADPAALAAYGPLSDDKGRRFTLTWRGAGVAEVFEVLDGVPLRVADRDAAGRLTNTRLYIERARLPAPQDDEFYLADLIGLAAVDAGGETIGRVAVVHDYGAGASLEIAREGPPLIVPFTRAAVPEIDIAGGRVVVSLPDEVEAGEAGEEAGNTPPPLEGGGRGEGSLPVPHRNFAPRDPSPQPPPSRGGGVSSSCNLAPVASLRP